MDRSAPLDRDRAWTYLLDLLTRRDYTEAELRAKLQRRKVEADVADTLLGRLRELGLADDARFTENYVASRRRSRGRLALRTELRRKGVDPSLVERELEPLTEGQQVEAAAALLRRFAWRYQPGSTRRRRTAAPAQEPASLSGAPSGAPSGAGPDPDAGREAEAGRDAEARRDALAERARAFAFLARRGFTGAVAGDAIRVLGWWQDAS
jgi:SOS response regulatory protein OraA/RecX